MAVTESKNIVLGMKAPNFLLQDVVSTNYYSLDDLKSERATVIAFLANHCPYVIHINQELVRIANEYKQHGVSFIAVSSNDIEAYPEDAPDKMKIVAKVLKYPFPYLYDKRQNMANEYDAVCTPDFYVFNKNLELFYRGRLDASSPGNNKEITGKDLRKAIDKTLLNENIKQQHPSIGCSIKWKE